MLHFITVRLVLLTVLFWMKFLVIGSLEKPSIWQNMLQQGRVKYNIICDVAPNRQGYLEVRMPHRDGVSYLIANRMLFINDIQYILVDWLTQVVQTAKIRTSN